MNAKTEKAILSKITDAEAKTARAYNHIDDRNFNNGIHFLLQAIQLLQQAVFQLQANSAKSPR